MNEVERLVISTPSPHFGWDPTLGEKIGQLVLQNTQLATRYEALVQRMEHVERMQCSTHIELLKKKQTSMDTRLPS